jgi:3-oxoacyl-[acyl-carrier protein] reductase
VQLNNHTYVVTGASQGLGRAVSLSLAEKGAIVALLDINQAGLTSTLETCRKHNTRCSAFTCDVSDESQVQECFDAVNRQLGPIAGLVNNAGVLRDALLVKVKDGEIVDRLSLMQWQQVIDINLTGVFLCGREAATHMIRHGQGGVIINISSISRVGNAGQSSYAAAKAGVVALTTTWALELARYQIRSAAIAPGIFETDMVASMKPEARERITRMIPLGRTGKLSELADTVKYIIENDYINGRVIELDGGLRL